MRSRSIGSDVHLAHHLTRSACSRRCSESRSITTVQRRQLNLGLTLSRRLRQQTAFHQNLGAWYRGWGQRRISLKLTPARRSEISLVEPIAAGGGQGLERLLSTQALELREVMLGLGAPWPGADDVHPIAAVGTDD